MASKLAASNSKPVPNSNMEVSSAEQEGNAPAMDHQADEIEGSPSSGHEQVTAPILKMEQGNLGHILHTLENHQINKVVIVNSVGNLNLSS